MATGRFDEMLKALSAEYREGLPVRLAQIEQLWSDYVQLARGEALAGLRRELHSLAGSAKTFGLPALGDAARAAESFMTEWPDTGGPPDAGRRAEFERLMGALRRSAAGS